MTTHPTPNLAGHQLLTVRAIDVRPGDLLAGLGEWCTAGRNDDSTEGETSTRSIVLVPLDGSEPRPLHILAGETVSILRPITSWTDPNTGDAYDLTGVLVDAEDDAWRLSGWISSLTGHPVPLMDCTGEDGALTCAEKPLPDAINEYGPLKHRATR